jgi:hypothetical protein
VPIRTVENAPARVFDIVGRCEPDCQLCQLGSSSGRSSCVRILGRLLDGSGDLAIRLGRGERKMPRSFLLARHEQREARMERASLGRSGARGHRGTEEWMRKAETVLVDLENSRLECARQSSRCLAAGGGLHEAHRRVGERGNDPRNLDSWSLETIKTLVNELFEIHGDRKLSARIDSAASSFERACELESEKGIPARRFPDAQERRPGKGGVEARSQ